MESARLLQLCCTNIRVTVKYIIIILNSMMSVHLVKNSGTTIMEW